MLSPEVIEVLFKALGGLCRKKPAPVPELDEAADEAKKAEQ